MIKRLLTPLILVLMLTPGLTLAAPTIDGILSEDEWTRYGGSFTEESDNKTPGSGNPGNAVGNYDLEKMGLLITDTQLIFGVSGDYNLKNGIGDIAPGDFAFSFDGGNNYELGVNYFVYNNHSVALQFRWGALDWDKAVDFPDNSPWQVGDSDEKQWITTNPNKSYHKPGNQGRYKQWWENHDNKWQKKHGLEVALNLSDLHSDIRALFKDNADQTLLRLTMECGNDVITSAYGVSAVPEPGTVLLFGAGLLGLSAVGRKRALKA